MPKKKWDQGLDLEYLLSKFKRVLRNPKNDKDYCYTSILYVQLRNGARIGEAVKAYMVFLKTGKREFEVEIEKRKDGEVRRMVIPEGLERDRCIWIADEDYNKLVDRLKNYAKRRHKVNTHSIRYAFITFLLKEGVPESIVAKVTGHKKLDYILEYTQKKAAEEVLHRLEM